MQKIFYVLVTLSSVVYGSSALVQPGNVLKMQNVRRGPPPTPAESSESESAFCHVPQGFQRHLKV